MSESEDSKSVDVELEAIEEPAATEQEKRQAAALAGALQGGGASEEERPLLAAATMVRASLGQQEKLPAGRAAELVEAAVAEVADRGAQRRAPRRRWRAARLVAMAACLVLVSITVLTTVPLMKQSRDAATGVAPMATVSRPSNDLLGRPIRDRAGAARRLDRVFADRLAGYRTLTLAGR